LLGTAQIPPKKRSCRNLNRIKNVVFSVPKIEISGESDIYVKTGSTVSLKCVITQSLEEPAYIFWYHDGERVLKYDRSAIDIRTDRVGTDTTVSTLIIFHARTEDSGNYTCSPSNLDSASVLLHVLNGELRSGLFARNRIRPSRGTPGRHATRKEFGITNSRLVASLRGSGTRSLHSAEVRHRCGPHFGGFGRALGHISNQRPNGAGKAATPRLRLLFPNPSVVYFIRFYITNIK
jgi:hypothetical protein